MFGRKKATPVWPQPPVDADGRIRAIPREFWSGPTGALLSAVGMSPDDPENIVPTAQDQEAKLAEAKRGYEKRLASENAEVSHRFPGCSVEGYFIFADDVWNGRHASFLIDILELSPWDDWNVRYFASDARSADALRTMRLPQGHGVAMAGAVNKILDQASAEYWGKWEKAGETKNFGAFADAKRQTQADMAGYANFFYEKMLEIERRA